MANMDSYLYVGDCSNMESYIRGHYKGNESVDSTYIIAKIMEKMIP